MLDAEGGSQYPWRSVNGEGVRQRKVLWNPRTQDPPAEGEFKWDDEQRKNVPCPGEGEWQTCLVDILNYTDLTAAYGWLNAGAHPFRSVGMDSLTFVQKRCKDLIANGETMTDRQWGDLLTKMERQVKDFVDLVRHPIKPVQCVTFLALTETRGGIRKPAIQGGLSIGLPAFVDLEGYLYASLTTDGGTDRKLLISPIDPTYQAKDRTHVISKHYGPVITNPDIEEMLYWKEAGENG